MTKDIRELTEPELKVYFNLLMDATAEIMPDGVLGFTIIVVDTDHICQYASTLQREDNIDALREMADRLERRKTIERQ